MQFSIFRIFILFAVLGWGVLAQAATGSSWYANSNANNWSAEESPARKLNKKREIQNAVELSPFSPGSHNIALDLGQVFLMGDLANYANSIGTQLHYTYGVSELFAFDSSLGYSEHSNGQLSMASLLTGLRTNLSWFDKVVPYAILGLGFYRPGYSIPSGAQLGTGTPVANGTTDGATNSVSSILFGIHLGTGVDLELSRNVFFGASLIVHNMFGTTQVLPNGIPFNLGGTYTSFFVHTGFTF